MLPRAAEEPAGLGLWENPQGEHASATQNTEFTIYTQLSFKEMFVLFLTMCYF